MAALFLNLHHRLALFPLMVSGSPNRSSLVLLLPNSHKGWQGEGVTPILHAEDAQQEAVHDEKNTSPSQDDHLLGFRIGYPWRLDGKRDSSERQDGIWVG